ncbi:MAG: TasA family protein [Acutalibacteraceae bacterium]
MKKKFSIFALLVAVIAVISLGTYAWFSASGTANNRTTFGDIEIELISELKATPFERSGQFVTKVDEVNPGDVFANKVTVKNVSRNHTAWVRLRLGPVWNNVENVPHSENAYESLDSFKKAVYPAEYNFNVGEGATQWSFSDGWWYYNSPLAAGEVAEPLFSQVSFSAQGLNDSYYNSNFEITFTAQAVQFENNADNHGDTWQDAVGWPQSE